MRATESAAAAAAAEKEEAKQDVKVAFNAPRSNFKWTKRANRLTLATSLKRCLARGIKGGKEMLEEFGKALSATGEKPPASLPMFLEHAKEMSITCLAYYKARDTEMHSGRTLPPDHVARQIAECLTFFSGTDKGTPTMLSSKALETFFAYGMAISERSGEAKKYAAGLAVKKKRLEEQAAAGLLAATGNASKKARVSRKQRKPCDEEEDGGEEEEDDEDAQEHVLEDTSAFSTPTNGGGDGKQGRSKRSTAAGSLFKATSTLQAQLSDLAKSTRSVELARLQFEEKKFEMLMEEQRKEREERAKAQELERKKRARAQELDRLERQEQQRVQNELMLAVLKALQDKKS